ncbi:MAG: hypothetical protein JW746_06785 [Candidatus Krumholzibacteriota bacterium]|nr:hypothetical protein [Candidatus Krumholzibacteriota bacterium]
MGLLKKNMGQRVGIIGNVLVFLFSGIDSLENAGVLVFAVNIAGAAINLFAFFLSKKSPVKTSISIFLMNSVFFAFMSYHAWHSGAEKIQYGWAFASLMNLVGARVFWLKSGK